MTAQEKCIVEAILVDVGLEPLHVVANEQETRTKQVTGVRI
ncbi:MAG: hypothetical protein P4L59_11225 [Desulfosporosinus sp.]|nr:hypothetical protein [Desulfosporosinus sp.]